ncbi:MAG: hypothetical protein AB1792_08830 [Candidatus Zixiibacteriota bacterium]
MDISRASDIGHVLFSMATDVVHIVLICFSLLLFLYQMRQLRGARFLKSLAFCWAFMGLSYLGRILLAVVTYVIAKYSTQLPVEITAARILRVSDIWYLADSVISLTSTYFLIRAWYLIKKYPETHFTKEWSSASLGFVGAVIAATITAVASNSDILAFLMQVVDVLAAAVAAIGVGLAFGTWKEPVTSIPRAGVVLLRFVTLICFSLWGLLQLVWLLIPMSTKGWVQPSYLISRFVEPASVYFLTLMMAKFVCSICAAIYGIIFLKDASSQPGTAAAS